MSGTLRKRIENLEKRRQAHCRQLKQKYQGYPVEYIRDHLRQKLWSKQEEICRLLLKPPYKVLVKACHNVGKTFISACLTSWWFDCFPNNSCVITTAPTHRDICDLLWREVRVQRRLVGLTDDLVGTAAPELWDHDGHFAKGFTADKFYVGRHLRYMLFIFDEAVGVKATVWEQMKSMFKPEPGMAWLAVGNPTDTSSQMYAEEVRGDWHLVQMSALEHPNVIAELEGRLRPYPAAVSLGQWNQWLTEWCDAIPASEADSTSIEWPPRSGHWYKPGPEMEARALGRWPSQSTYGVWSDAAWVAAQTGDKLVDHPYLRELPVIGCDPARRGHNYTAIHWRCGGRSLGHERHNGWEGPQIVGRLKELCREMAAWANARREPGMELVKPEQIRVNIDPDGMGGLGVVDWGGDYCFVGIGASASAIDQTRYPNRRAELWFGLPLRAKRGMLDLSGLDAKTLQRLRQQFMGPVWKLDGEGRRVVEKKEVTEKRLKVSSPDDADACNLAYAEDNFGVPEIIAVDSPRPFQPHEDSAQRRRGYYGRT